MTGWPFVYEAYVSVPHTTCLSVNTLQPCMTVKGNNAALQKRIFPVWQTQAYTGAEIKLVGSSDKVGYTDLFF